MVQDYRTLLRVATSHDNGEKKTDPPANDIYAALLTYLLVMADIFLFRRLSSYVRDLESKSNSENGSWVTAFLYTVVQTGPSVHLTCL
jgi:hypothetical protein